MTTIHATDRRGFRNCRRRFRYAHLDRLAIKTDGGTGMGALSIGSACHHAVAQYYYGIMAGQFEDPVPHWYDYVSREKLHADAEVEHLCTSLLKRYVAKYYETEKKYIIHGVELPLEVVIEGVKLVGTLDLLYEKGGRLLLMDHKFVKDLIDFRVLEMDDQMTTYIWLAHECGFKVAGATYDEVRKKLPAEPDRNLNGSLSRKNIETDHATMMECINRYGLDPSDYADRLQELKTQSDPFFHRTPVMRNAKELAAFEQNLRGELRDLSNPDLVYYPNPGDQCKRCDFQMLCKAENEGANTLHLTEAFFRTKKNSER